MKSDKLTFGSDPEFLLTDAQGRCKSAIGVLKGNRDNRVRINRSEFFYDNVFAECAICPSMGKQETVINFQLAFRTLRSLVEPYRIVPQASCVFPASELNCKEAFEAGCDPDTCAYTLQEHKADETTFLKTRLRTAGGHIHLGHNILQKMDDQPENYYNRLYTVKMLDLFLGIPSIFINGDKTEKARKALYGKAGNYRERDHGIEYRPLSNFWLASPNLVKLVYDICEFTFCFVAEGKHWDLWKVDFEMLNSDAAWESLDFDSANCHTCHGYDVVKMRTAINTMDRTKGKVFLEFIKQFMPQQLYESILAACTPKDYDFYREWLL
jgi:hypothetical protein